MASPSGSEPLPNPERHWARRGALGSFDLSEVERCLGRVVGPSFELLSGGLANLNVRVGDDVVRVHRRDPSAAVREAAALTLPWKNLRVPTVRRSGPGFLVLEHVAHGPLTGSAHHGAAAGSALAAVHARTFDRAGHLDATLRGAEHFEDLVCALIAYARAELAGEGSGLGVERGVRLTEALEAVAPALRDAAGPPVFLHGDFKPSNLHWANDDRLLVLDWEFAYAGSALSDVGQLLRWGPPEPFVAAFADAYRAGGGRLVDGWQRHAAAFDLVNLAGLAANLGGDGGEGAARRIVDISRRIDETLELLGAP